MSAAFQWEEVEVPRGAFLSWGTTIGQAVTGKVLSYDETGGTDFAGNTCPQLQVELIDPAYSINKEGQRSDFPAGELVVLNCGLVSLKRAVRAASPAPGDIIKIELSNLVKVDKGTVKEFGIKIARGAGGSTKPAATQQSAPAATSDVPAGFTAEQWAGMPEATKAAILAAQ